MATRVLPGAYVSLNDLSQVPEGQSALTVGYVIKANRGPVNELSYVTSPADFLKKYTFSGKPSITDDKTYFSILKVLSKTNAMYVSRACNNPLYGGLIIKAPVLLTDDSYTVEVTKAVKVDGTDKAYFIVDGDVSGKIDTSDIIQISDKEPNNRQNFKKLEGYYTVSTVTYPSSTGATTTKIEVLGDLEKAYDSSASEASGVKVSLGLSCGVGLNSQKIANIANAISSSKSFTISGNYKSCFAIGSTFRVKDSAEENNKVFTVLDNEEADPIHYDPDARITTIKVKENVADSSTGAMFYDGLGSPDNYRFTSENELLLITGKDPGAYNHDISIDIVSSVDNKNMVYRKGADIGGQECTFDTIQISVYNDNTNELLETFLCSRDPNAKTIDGITLYVETVLANSSYIQVRNNKNEDGSVVNPSVECISSVNNSLLSLTGGSNGEEVNYATMEKALQPFYDKTVSISLLGNGCFDDTFKDDEDVKKYQQALLAVAEERKDCMVFLNAPIAYEKETTPSVRATGTVEYKKDLGSTSFYGCMYTPHVNYSDIYNSRTVKIGSDAIAIAGWLDVINNLNYPYAYAGPKNGLVTGVTCDWKIGDTSGEAQIMNDASVNYVAYDGKVGRYYMQCQNTLQVANSAMRNIGTVLNVLDIKEHFVTLLKEFIQLPITDSLRRDIRDVSIDYLNPLMGVRFYNYSFQDVTTAIDIADNTLRYLLILQPTMYAQKIYLTMNIVNATFDFSIVQSA